MVKNILNGIKFFLKFYLFLRERERETEPEWGRGREWGDTESKAGSRLWAVSIEPDVGLELTGHKIVTWAEVGCLTDWATQAPHILNGINSRLDPTEEKHSKLEYIAIEIYLKWNKQRKRVESKMTRESVSYGKISSCIHCNSVPEAKVDCFMSGHLGHGWAKGFLFWYFEFRTQRNKASLILCDWSKNIEIFIISHQVDWETEVSL